MKWQLTEFEKTFANHIRLDYWAMLIEMQTGAAAVGNMKHINIDLPYPAIHSTSGCTPQGNRKKNSNNYTTTLTAALFEMGKCGDNSHVRLGRAAVTRHATSTQGVVFALLKNGISITWYNMDEL